MTRKYPNRGWATATSKGRSIVVHRRMVTVPRYVVPRHWSSLLTVRIRRWSRRPPSTVVSEMGDHGSSGGAIGCGWQVASRRGPSGQQRRARGTSGCWHGRFYRNHGVGWY
ncbi:hypothetical protein GQ457_10G021680 [Hibiscus cannabinus]